MSEQPTETDALRAGQAHLAAAEWRPARRAFGEAVAADPTPEALEGLSWAAWWLDDADTVFDARERAYRGYRAADDPCGAARMATWLAADHLDFRAATGVAAGWLRRAHRLLDPLDTRPEHGWLAFEEGFLANVRGDINTALRSATLTTEVGRGCAVPDLEMLGLALEGSILVGITEVDEGMRRLDEATAMALAEPTENPISSSWAFCFLVATCVSVLDYERAAEACGRIATMAEHYGSHYIDGFWRAEYGAVQLWRGSWTAAAGTLTAAVEDFAVSRPAMVAGPLGVLAELRRRQGWVDEAEQLLARAGPTSDALLCRSRLAFDRGNARRSVELVERMLRQSPPERTVDRAPAYEHLIRSRVALGDLDGARADLARLRDIAKVVGTDPVHALTLLAEGTVVAAEGEHEAARTLFEDALDRFDRSGAPFETACARIELATSLAALGRAALASQEAAAAADALRRLGAPAEERRARQLLGTVDGTGPSIPVTRRERDVLALVAEGLTNRQIAERLVVSEHTVHRHVTNILRKLDLPSRTAAAAYAARAGVVRSE